MCEIASLLSNMSSSTSLFFSGLIWTTVLETAFIEKPPLIFVATRPSQTLISTMFTDDILPFSIQSSLLLHT